MPKHERGEVERLEKLMNKFERGLVPHIDWLDRLSFKAIEGIRERESKCNGSNQLNLILDLRTFEHPVAFQVLLHHFILRILFPNVPKVLGFAVEVFSFSGADGFPFYRSLVRIY